MTCMFFLIPKVNEDMINKDDNEQVYVLFENSIKIKSIKAAGALVIPIDITTNL